MTFHIVKRLVLIPLLLAATSLPAQNTPDLRRLARDAGLIFSGTVARAERVAPAARGDIGVVRVTFQVHEAFRGVTAGQSLTISEWDGLWTSGERYRAGESLLVFFYAPSGQSGLTSTVAGRDGRISLAELRMSASDIAREIGASTTATESSGAATTRGRSSPEVPMPPAQEE